MLSMPNSPLSSNPSADVRAFLTDVMPDAQLSDESVHPGYQPLLFMRTKHTIAAFAFANGDIPKSYETLYTSFKSYYASQQANWDSLDLAFVFCVHGDFSRLEHFCSNVETDVYFCRKFVVRLTPPLGGSLARLPFLPLAPLHGQTIRPASAQTFLQQCGVTAPLAKAIVVRHERSPDGIVEDCTSGKFGDPRPITLGKSEAVVQSRCLTEPVKLQTLEIQNFRAYRKLQSFTLGADVTVLYGPNGFGKTSFFDALDFAITGGIGRLEARPTDFVKAARHLDAGSEESAVTLTFRNGGAVHKIIRSVRDRKHALLDGRPTDRKSILSELTCGNIPATDRVENFVSLFRASHLFSQEQQELTKDFQNDCELSGDIVSRMLAFEDYANAVKKAARVRDLLQTAITTSNEEIRRLTEQIAADSRDLDSLGQSAIAHANVATLENEIDSLRTKLKEVGIATTLAKADAAMIRGWRAALESYHAQSRASRDRLTILLSDVSRLPRTRSEFGSVQNQVLQKESALKAAEEKRGAAELAAQRAESRLAEMTAKRHEAQSRADLFEWVKNTRPVHTRLVAQERQIAGEVGYVMESMTQFRLVEENAIAELRSKEAIVAQIAETVKAWRAKLVEVQALRRAVPHWQANRTRHAALVQSEQELLRALELLRSEERELTPRLETVTAEEQRLVRHVAEADKNQSELRRLVSQLQGHILTGVCPLCGEDHGTKQQLLQRIQNYVMADAASGARKDLTDVRQLAKQLTEGIATNRQKQQSADGQRAVLRNERTKLESEIADSESAAFKLGIGLEIANSSLIEQVNVVETQLQQQLAGIEKENQAARNAVESARSTSATASSEVSAKQAEAAEKKTTLLLVRDEIKQLLSGTRLTQISLDIEPDHLAELARLNLINLEELKIEVTKADEEVNQKKQEIGLIRQEIASLKAQLVEARAQLADLQKTITQITAKLEEAKLPPDTGEQSLHALITKQSQLQEQLLTLRDTASSLELAMDTATTAAALTTLQRNVRNREESRTRAGAAREQRIPWVRYFEEALRLLSSQQNEAIATLIREYGPRTSIIQQRLRSVYGFDDIEIKSRDSAIIVRVKRNGEELRPVDYFSQSQQQTLLLGLFLTACTAQTWSEFSTVFLDDPVTHFDDLNTYSLLDLLVGLLECEAEKRQFVLSTCDERLHQLARQKFRTFGERAKFYRFTAIGSDGPIIEEEH